MAVLDTISGLVYEVISIDWYKNPCISILGVPFFYEMDEPENIK